MDHDDTLMGTRSETPPEPRGSSLAGLVGRTIAERYRIDALIGEGGMGAVFAAFHLGMKREIAVKVLLPILTSHAEAAARFEREAQAASRLEHPNIVKVFDFGAFTYEGNDLKYLVMERLEGRELAAELGRPLPQEEARRIAVEIFDGLAHAHAHGVVHRDLKPENIFLSSKGPGTVKLVDFGIAKLLDGADDEVKLTRMGAIFGTPQYMSPEQAIGEEVDHRSDLYAAGLILYEMLTGAPPFSANDVVALLRMQIQATPPPIPGLHPSFARLLDGLLAKDRAARLASAQEAADLLRALDLTARPTSLWPVTMSDRIDALVERVPWASLRQRGARRWMPVAAGVAVLVGFTALSWGWSQRDPAVADEAAAALPAGDALKALADALPILTVPPSRVDGLRDLVLAGKTEAALHEADELLAAYPTAASIHWLRGDALAKLPDRRGEMLEAYRRALTIDPELVEDRTVYAQLSALIRRPEVTLEEIELLLAADAATAEPLVIELLNRKEGALDYPLRHRLLRERSPKPDDPVDLPLQTILDLWQAGTQTNPCHVFAETLTAMADEPRPEYVASLENVPTPSAVGGNAPCEGLEARRKELAATMRLQFPEAPAWTPPGYAHARKEKPKRRRRPFSSWFR